MELTTSRFDSAVSPVVGVILMVAVTVILAAVIGTFVLDLGNNVQENPQAGVSFDQTPADDAAAGDYAVSVQVISMENADELRAESTSSAADDASYTLDGVGQSASFDYDENGADPAIDETLNSGDTVTVIGVLDGKEAVLQSYTVE